MNPSNKTPFDRPRAVRPDSYSELLARRVFFWAGVYGTMVLLPNIFLERKIGQYFPPEITHPENFYGFISVALVWQMAFFAIARQPGRLLPLIPFSVLEKFLPSVCVFVLILMERAPMHLALFAAIDVIIGCAFLVSFLGLRKGMPDVFDMKKK